MGTSFPSLLSTRPNPSQRAIENGANASPQAFSDSSHSPLPLYSARHTVPLAIHWKRWDTVEDQLEVGTSRYSRICELAEEFGLGYRPMQLPTSSVDLDPVGNGACGNDSDIHSRRASTTMQIKIAAGSNMVQRIVMQPRLHLYSPLHSSPPPNLHLPLKSSKRPALIRAEALINTHADGASPRPEAFSRSFSGTWCSQSDYESHHLHVAMGTSAGKEVRCFYQIYTI